MKTIWLLYLLMAGCASAFAQTDACAKLATLKLTNATITSAQVVEAGAFSAPGARAQRNTPDFKELPAFCSVAATLTPSTDSDIKIEVWRPVTNWNNKLMAVGNGGWSGAISYPALAREWEFDSSERVNFEMRVELLNAFNNANFLNLTGEANPNPANQTFGQVTTAFTDVFNTQDPGGRLGLIVVRINF